MQIGLDNAARLHQTEAVRTGKKTLALIIIIAALFFLAIHFNYSPVPPYRGWHLLSDQIPGVIFRQSKRLLVTIGCGMMMALAGNIYQCVFRNPLAAPTMLGVSSGVEVALLFLFVTYQAGVNYINTYRYPFSYLGAGCMFVIVLLLAKLASGPGRFRIADMMLIGISVSNIVGALVSGYVIGMDENLRIQYQQIVNVTTMDTTPHAMLSLVPSFAGCMFLMYLMRFSFNAVSYDTDESRSFGVAPLPMRILTLSIGTYMIATAMIHCGLTAVLALVVPHISRYLYGPESRKMFWGNAFLGGMVLLACRIVSDVLPPIGSQAFPLGFVVSLFVLPAFMFAMGVSRKGVEK